MPRAKSVREVLSSSAEAIKAGGEVAGGVQGEIGAGGSADDADPLRVDAPCAGVVAGLTRSELRGALLSIIDIHWDRGAGARGGGRLEGQGRGCQPSVRIVQVPSRGRPGWGAEEPSQPPSIKAAAERKAPLAGR